MAINFPDSPSPGALFTGTNGVLYSYDGTRWLVNSSISSIIPPTNNTNDLGSPSLAWRSLYVNTLNVLSTAASTSSSTGALLVAGGVGIQGALHVRGQIYTQGFLLGPGAEFDPIYSTGTAFSITATNISNWNTAYSWGNHAVQGYITTGSYATLTNHLLPAVDSAIDLGSPTKKWRSLYVSTNTIFIGTTSLTIVDGQISLGGNVQVITTSSLRAGTDSVTLSNNRLSIPGKINFGTTGVGAPNTTTYIGEKLVLLDNGGAFAGERHFAIGVENGHMWFASDTYNDPGTGFKWYAAEQELMRLDSTGTLEISKIRVPYATSSSFHVYTTKDYGFGLVENVFKVEGNRIFLPSGNGLIQSGNSGDVWGLDSVNKSFTFPNESDIEYGDGGALSTGTLQVKIDFGGEFRIVLADSNKTWIFNDGGDLILPFGGKITENIVTNELWDTTTTSLTLIPSGAAPGTDQQLEIYATGGGEGNHIHITSGDLSQTDLYLGNDTQYFAVTAYGTNVIQGRRGINSPNTSTSATPGMGVAIYGGAAGANGGNVLNGASGGDVFLQGGTSSAGLGGPVYLVGGTGPSGSGSIRLSTDNGSTFLEFDKDDNLTFPSGGNITFDSSASSYIYGVTGIEFAGGTTHTGTSIYVPYATSSSFKITTVDDNMGMGPYQEKTFEVRGNTLYLPGANLIADGELWQLSSSGYLRFPTGGQIVYGDGLNTLNTGTLKIFAFDENNHGQGTAVVINTNNEQEWRFESTGELRVPGNIVGFDPPMAYERVVLQPSPAVQDSFLFYVDQTAGTFNRAGIEMPYADEDKAVTLAFPHNNNTVGYIFNQGTDTISGTELNNALNIMMNAGDVRITALSAGTYTSWTFKQNGGLRFPDGTTQTTAFTGTSALLDITNTNGLATTYYITFVESRTSGQEVRADVDLTYNTADNLLGVGGIVFSGTSTQTIAWTKSAVDVQSSPPSSPVKGQLYYDTDDGRTYVYTGSAWVDSNPAGGGGGGVTSLTAGTGTFVSSTSGAITIWVAPTTTLEETFESKNAITGVTVHDCTSNRLFYITNAVANFTPNFTNLNLAAGEATSISLVVVQTSTARSISGVQIASTTSGVTLTWQGSATAPSGNASRTEVFTFSILCTATNNFTVLGMMTSFGGA